MRNRLQPSGTHHAGCRTSWTSAVLLVSIGLVGIDSGCRETEHRGPVTSTPLEECDPLDPEAPTPLGIRGIDVWMTFEGMYESTVTSKYENEDESKGRSVMLQLRVERTGERTSEPLDCSSIAVPVRVSFTTSDGEVDETVAGWLSSDDLRDAMVVFRGTEDAAAGESATQGQLLLSEGTMQAFIYVGTGTPRTLTSPPPTLPVAGQP